MLFTTTVSAPSAATSRPSTAGAFRGHHSCTGLPPGPPEKLPLVLIEVALAHTGAMASTSSPARSATPVRYSPFQQGAVNSLPPGPPMRGIYDLSSTPPGMTLPANCPCAGGARDESRMRDRKSTRLNSSHLVISYAVFC